MAFIGQTYTADPSNVAGDYQPVPPGDYVVQVESSDIKDARKAGNRFIELTLLIIEGEHANRKLTDRINLWNDNPKAVEIAQRTLNALCVAVGKMSVSDTTELHGIPMLASVKVKPGTPYEKDGQTVQGSPQNEIGTYKPISQRGAASSPAPAVSAGPASAGAPTASGGMPWKRAG